MVLGAKALYGWSALARAAAAAPQDSACAPEPGRCTPTATTNLSR